MNLIVAADRNWGIGKNGGLLCHLPGDLRYFKEKTGGKVVVMGRSTLESLPGGMPLPNRTNIVITRQQDFEKDGCITVHSISELKENIKKYDKDDVMIIGGASIYNALMEECDKLYITKILADFDADVFIKNVDELKAFKMTEDSPETEENGIRYHFTVYEREITNG